MTGIRLIVGLGNPGREYRQTRHNAGFWLVDALAAQHHVALKPESRFHGQAVRVVIGAHELWLLEPQTYMNASGRAVAALAAYYKIAPEEILVAHDELDLPPGAARLKKGGGHGGHNGLRDILPQLKTPEFWRLRLGIGHPGDKDAVVDYVLNAPRREEQPLIDEAIAKSLTVLPHLLAGDLAAAMKQLHTQEKT